MVDQISSDMLLKQVEQVTSSVNAKQNVAQTDEDGNDFSGVLTKLIDDVDVAQKQADVSLKKLAAGEATSIQDVVLKMEEADISFKLMKEIRDKLLQAYKEVMGMST